MLRLFGGIDRHRTVFEGHRTNFQGLAIHRTCFHVLGRFPAPGVRWVHRTWTPKCFPVLQDYVGTVVPTHWQVFQELTNHRNKLSGIWLFEGFDSHRTVIQGLHIYRTNFQGQTQTTSICTRSSSPVHILVNCEPIDSKLSLLLLVGWVQRPLPCSFGLLAQVFIDSSAIGDLIPVISPVSPVIPDYKSLLKRHSMTPSVDLSFIVLIPYCYHSY